MEVFLSIPKEVNKIGRKNGKFFYWVQGVIFQIATKKLALISERMILGEN